MAVVTMDHVSKQFDSVLAVRDLNLTIQQDETVAFLDLYGAGKTIILTTRHLEEANAIADRVVVIDWGVLIADGTPASIKARVVGKRISFVRLGVATYKTGPWTYPFVGFSW